MTCTLTTEPVTINELMTNIAFSSEVIYFKTEDEAQAALVRIRDREVTFGRTETFYSVEPAGKCRPRGMKFLLFVKRCGR
jgi:hypothetical protein